MPCYKSIQAHQAPAHQNVTANRCLGVPTQSRPQKLHRLRTNDLRLQQKSIQCAAQQTNNSGQEADSPQLLIDAAQPSSLDLDVEGVPGCRLTAPLLTPAEQSLLLQSFSKQVT